MSGRSTAVPFVRHFRVLSWIVLSLATFACRPAMDGAQVAQTIATGEDQSENETIEFSARLEDIPCGLSAASRAKQLQVISDEILKQCQTRRRVHELAEQEGLRCDGGCLVLQSETSRRSFGAKIRLFSVLSENSEPYISATLLMTTPERTENVEFSCQLPTESNRVLALLDSAYRVSCESAAEANSRLRAADDEGTSPPNHASASASDLGGVRPAGSLGTGRILETSSCGRETSISASLRQASLRCTRIWSAPAGLRALKALTRIFI